MIASTRYNMCFRVDQYSNRSVEVPFIQVQSFVLGLVRASLHEFDAKIRLLVIGGTEESECTGKGTF